MSHAADPNLDRGAWHEFWTTPLRLRLHLLGVAGVALLAPPLLHGFTPVAAERPVGFTAVVLVALSVLNVEISRITMGGLARAQQPHKALSAWAFASVLLLPAGWLLVVVPLTYAHARWRGLRVPLWKWIGSAGYLVVAGLAAAEVVHALAGPDVDWMAGQGGFALLAMVAAAATFLLVETLLFTGSALLNRAEDEVWLRQTLTGTSFYLTESAVLLTAGLLAAVWDGGAWYVTLFVPIYALVQRAALHEPLRERAEAAAELGLKNDELELANQFKIDLLGMLGHEIGQPLTSIQGYAQVGAEAVDDGDCATAKKAFEVVERNALQIRDVAHDILALVSSDRGALTAYPQERRLEQHLRAAASAHPVGRRPTVECPTGLVVWVQPSHLDQILSNLLTNATKYAGGATELIATATADGRVEVAVIDAGPGVPPGFRDLIFTRFSRDAATAEQVMGTGLGLFIARELARANGGDLTHRDGCPTGSIFTVTLPRAA